MKEDTKNAILEIGTDLIIGKGYNNVGLQEILKKAKVPKGSFYYYFKSKEDFGLQVIAFYSDKSLSVLKGYLYNKEESPKNRIVHFFGDMKRNYGKINWEQGCLLGNCSLELSDLKKSFSKKLSSELNKWQVVFEECILEGQQSGEINSDFSGKELAAYLLNGWEGALLRMKAEKSSEPIDIFIKFIDKILA